MGSSIFRRVTVPCDCSITNPHTGQSYYIRETMEGPVTILNVLEVDICAQEILDYVPLSNLVRSERVSRRWQQVVRQYLQHTKLSLNDCLEEYLIFRHELEENTHREILMHKSILAGMTEFSLPYLSKTLEKWGSSIDTVVTNHYMEEFFEIIAARCPNLNHIKFCDVNKKPFPIQQIKKCRKLKQISLKFILETPEHTLGKLFQNINCEKIDISLTRRDYPQIDFRFLQHVHTSYLTSLSLSNECTFRISDLIPFVDTLRNLRSLELDSNDISVYTDLHRLLNVLPQLENLSLMMYLDSEMDLSKELIDSFSRLGNLKRLIMKSSDYVTEELLAAVARGCRKLEYLDVRRSRIWMKSSTVAALCSIPSPLTIAFNFPYIYNVLCSSVHDVNKLIAEAKDVPLLKELEESGFKLMWTSVVCQGYYARKMHRVTHLKLGCIGPQSESYERELLLYLSDPPMRV